MQGGLFDALDRAGVDVRVDTGGGYQFGPHREIDARNADSVWYVIEESGLTSVLSEEPGAHVLAKSTPLIGRMRPSSPDSTASSPSTTARRWVGRMW